ncbi:Uncharacterised protein [uncultured archaeon]|nr:Uncharacterised protein [uncultured archaeon]
MSCADNFSCSFFESIIAKESMSVGSPIPSLIFPRGILAIYLASVGEEELKSSASNFILSSWLPVPSLVAIFFKFKKTFSIVSACENSEPCFFFLMSSSAVFPRSPVLLKSASTSAREKPVAFAIPSAMSFSPNPISFPSKLGAIRPCRR